MLFLNSKPLTVNHFPDGTQMLNIEIPNEKCFIRWEYENEEEYMTLFYVVKHIRNNSLIPNHEIDLIIPYIPNARMDRIKDNSEVFTLKYFADFINSLNFNSVWAMDFHSYVSAGLFNNLHEIDVRQWINTAIRKVWSYTSPDYSKITIYFPDEGAMKRYSDIIPKNMGIIYGRKTRDWETGKIKNLEIINDSDIDISSSVILMIDDIISYGGTLSYSADKLKELGCGPIFAYATHTENSVDNKEKSTILKRLEEGVIVKVFTTKSLYKGNNEKIEILDNYGNC